MLAIFKKWAACLFAWFSSFFCSIKGEPVMSALSVEVPFPVFYDRSGEPLENGYVWIGQANLNPQTNPIQVYFDKNLTQPAAQPLRTLAGYISNAGTPAQIYVDNLNYSILVQDKNGTMVYNFPQSTNDDACSIVYDPPFVNAVPTTVCSKLEEVISVKDFGAIGNGVVDDTGAFINALAAAGGNTVYVPSGSYKITGTLDGNFATFGNVTIVDGYVNYINNVSVSNSSVVMYRTVNSTNSTPGKWVVLTPEGPLNTTGSTTEGLQEAINYITQYGYDLYVYGSPVGPPNFPPPYTSFNGQEPAIMFLNSPITFYPLQKGVIKITDVTLNFNSPVTGAAITFDSIIIADIDFSGSQIVCAAAQTGVLFKPTNFLPQDAAAGIVISDCRIKLCAVYPLAPGSNCVSIDCTDGPFIGVDLNISELNAGAYGLIVDPATNGFISNKIFILDAHDQTSASLSIGTNATNGINAYGNIIEFFAQPDTGCVGIDMWGVDNIVQATVLGNQGLPAVAIKLESSASQNIIQAGRLQGTILIQDLSTTKSNLIQYGSDACSVYLIAASQSIPNNSATKILFDDKEFDQMNTFNTALSRWIPGVPGNGQISANINYLDALPAGSVFKAAVYKNGNVYKQTADVSGSNVGGNSIGISCTVQIDSPTDYFEIYAFQNSGGAKNMSGNQIDTWATFKRL